MLGKSTHITTDKLAQTSSIAFGLTALPNGGLSSNKKTSNIVVQQGSPNSIKRSPSNSNSDDDSEINKIPFDKKKKT